MSNLDLSNLTLDELVTRWENFNTATQMTWLRGLVLGGWLKICCFTARPQETREQDKASLWRKSDGSLSDTALKILKSNENFIKNDCWGKNLDDKIADRVHAYILAHIKVALAFVHNRENLIFEQTNRQSLNLHEIADKLSIPLGFLDDLRGLYINPQHGRAGVGSEHIAILTVDEQKNGDVSKLTVDLMPDGHQEIYPHPKQSLVALDNEFHNGFYVNVKEYLLKSQQWPNGYDLRWHLTDQGGNTLYKPLEGQSATAAFAAVALQLFQKLVRSDYVAAH